MHHARVTISKDIGCFFVTAFNSPAEGIQLGITNSFFGDRHLPCI